jgi:hypothetical protein
MLRTHILVMQLHILPLHIGHESKIYLFQSRSPPFLVSFSLL